MTKSQLYKAPREELVSEIIKLQEELAWFKRQVFGTKSERFVPNDEQTSLALDINNNKEIPTHTENVSYERVVKHSPKEGHSRGAMPTHLPFKDVVIEPNEDVSACTYIGDEISWEFEYEPGSLFVKRYIRKKYALPKGDGIIVADLPARVIEKGNAGAGFIAAVMIDKYLYHMPLDRQRKKFKNEFGVEFSESWMCDVVRQGCFWIEPVYSALVAHVKKSSYIQADETPIQVLVQDLKGKTHRGYYWVYHDPIDKVVVFDYRQSRSRHGPLDFLKTFEGTLQVDGYEGYSEVFQRGKVIHAGCMDHVRRYFEKSIDNDKARAEFALNAIAPWYAIESDAKKNNSPIEQRFISRVKNTVPAMDEFKHWLQEQYPQVLPKSAIGKAISYALDQWDFFTPFKNDPKIELSNILVENAIRPVAIGRKNYLFKGSHKAAQRGAMIYSLVATATLHNANPLDYFKDLLEKLPAASTSIIPSMLPYNWNK